MRFLTSRKKKDPFSYSKNKLTPLQEKSLCWKSIRKVITSPLLLLPLLQKSYQVKLLREEEEEERKEFET